ncbi:uncharacterized protein UTRI_04354_B [Ustilago trichophora]|uniref:Uncharacterized protein n=1 Tax=Ustilago trichophora TaxID=86804 RepID=A0A5C3EAD9_9BASI|nr:uncharacterized protein UTRI_04354_B [Ustilago trichophora]
MASGSSTAGMDGSVSRKPSKLIARSNTLHRSPHGHSGSGAGLWLANSPSPKLATFSDNNQTSRSKDSQQSTTSRQDSPQKNKRVYHFSAELARASFGGRPLTLGGSFDCNPIYTNGAAGPASDDDGDVDLDLSFDYISRFDRSSSSSSDPQNSSGSALDSSREREMQPPTSHFSPDDTPESLQAESSHEMDPYTPAKSTLPIASTSSNSLSASTELSTSPSPNSKVVRSMRADADWDKRRKAPPAPLNLTPGSEAKRQRQLAMRKLEPPIEAIGKSMALLLRPASGELVGKSIFSPITPATSSVPLLDDFGRASHAAAEPLPLTPISATRRGAAVSRLPDVSTSSSSSSPLNGSSDESAAIRRAASTSAARAATKQQSSEALRRTPTTATATIHSPSYASNATPVQTRRARSHSNRSFRASASLASLGPPPFPPPNEPLPSPALSPSFQQHSLASTSAFQTANDAESTLSKAQRTRPSASSIDYSEAARSLRSRTTQTHRSSLDSFRTANSDNHSIGDGPRWVAGEMEQLPPLPPLQRYQALFPGQDDWAALPQQATGTTSMATSSTLTSVPMTLSNTVGSSVTTMTWSMSDRSTPSTHHSPLTPFTPVFSDMMPGTANSSKTHFTAITRPSISSEMQPKTATLTEMSSLGEAAATLKEASTSADQELGRGNRNTEQWILTQRQRKALLQHDELASHQRLFEADQAAVRLSIRADERTSQAALPSKSEVEAAAEARSRQDSRSTEATDDDRHATARQTMVISTVSTPDESADPFRFISGQPSLMPSQAAKMERAASHNGSESKAAAAAPMTRNRSGTTGPWPQSPLLLNFNVSQNGEKLAVQDSIVSPALTTIIHSGHPTPQLDNAGQKVESEAAKRESGVQGLGLDFDYPSSNAAQRNSITEGGKGFAPITTDLLRQASRCMNRYPQDIASPHLSIQMSPEAETLQRTRSKSKEALLTRGSRRNLDPGLSNDMGGPSPVLPNDCRSPRTVSGKEVGSSAPGGLSALVNSPLATDVAVHRAQLPTDRTLLHSQSNASSISAFVYNATPAALATTTTATTSTDADQHHRFLDVSSKPKTGSFGWRRNNSRRSRDHAQTLGLGMRPSTDNTADGVKFVNIDLDDGGLETEVALDRDDVAKSGDGAKAGQWVSKLWSAMASPRRTSFNSAAAPNGDRSVDLELANNSSLQSGEARVEQAAPAPVSKEGERTASRGSFRPLSLVEKRQSSGRYNLDMSRQRFRSPTPGEDDEIAEKDARAVALRLLAGSPRLAAPAEEGAGEATDQETADRADLSAEEREKQRIEALKKLRRMSAVERQRKRNSGIGYITSTSAAVESTRLPYVHDTSDDAGQQDVETSIRHGGLSRAGSVKNKRMSLTVFGGKERASTLPVSTANDAAAVGPERAWLDAMRSPRIADSPSGFTPRMAFEPHDWGAAQQQQQNIYIDHQPSTAAANHIPLLLSSSATAPRQARASTTTDDHGMTVSELDRARDEMRRLAGQGMTWQENEFAQEAGETFHTPMPDASESWTHAGYQKRSQFADAHHAPYDQASPHQASALGDFGISPEKNHAKLHRRTRTARFAVDDQHLHHHHEEYDDDQQPTVSIFTRSRHRHGASGSFSLHAQAPPLTANRSRSKRRVANHHAAVGGHGLFAIPASLLDSNTPSKNMFWAGFLGMPWLWMIGGWYLTPDGQLRHPSADERKVDAWQHEPSMQHNSPNGSPNPGSSSTTFGNSSYDQGWGAGAPTETGLGLTGMPSATSYAASSTNTASSAKTSTSDPNKPPPSKVRKSKTRSLGSLLDTNPQISFYQSPVRVVAEPQPSFAGVWRTQPMEPLAETEEPRRSRIFAAGSPFSGEGEQHVFAPSPASTSTFVAEPRAAEEMVSKVGSQVAVVQKGAQWKDLERFVLLNRVAAILSGVLVFAGFTGAVYAVHQQQQQQNQQKVKSAGDVFEHPHQRREQKQPQRQQQCRDDEEVGPKKGLTSWDAVRWLAGQPPPESPTKPTKSVSPQGCTAEAAATNNSNSSSLLLAGAAAALANTKTSTPSGLGNLLTTFLLNPTSNPIATAATSTITQEGTAVLSTVSHLVFLRAIFRIIFRVIVLVRIARFRNSATPISALVLNELLR